LADDVGREVAAGPVGWCPVATATADESGAYAWEFDGASTCATDPLPGGACAPGRGEVRAVAYDAHGQTVASTPVAFYVDPTGTILLQARAGVV
jgi:hypothetical protein